MRLDELNIFDERTLLKGGWKSPRQVKQFLLSSGFDLLGKGAYSWVYVQRNANRVVKISRYQDRGWLEYAKMALKNTTNPHLLDVRWVHKYGVDQRTGDKNAFFIAVTEKLARAQWQDISKLPDLDLVWLRYNTALFNHRWNTLYQDWYEHTFRDGKQGQFSKELGYAVSDRYKPQHQFTATVKSLMEKSGSGIFDDLHDDNIMVRQDGTLVVTDPFAS